MSVHPRTNALFTAGKRHLRLGDWLGIAEDVKR